MAAGTVSSSGSFQVLSSNPDITRAEYFIDADPGLGAATAGGWWYATQNKHIPARYQVPPVILAAAGLAAVTVAEWR